jgi:TetR/AcrR family transcriptional repressor of nem operon
MSTKREQILDAAMSATRRDGLCSVSFRQLAAAVGVKSASVHYHFPTKPDLAESMVRRYLVDFEARLADISQRRRTLIGKIEALISVFGDVLERDELCLCGMMAAELTALDSGTRLALRQFFNATEDWLRDEIETHRHEVRIDLASGDLARVLLAGLEGAVLLDRVDQQGRRLEAFRRLARATLG